MLYAIALISGYFALLAVLSVVARPYRARMAVLARDLLAAYPDDPFIQHLCEAYIKSAYSLRAAPVRLLSYILGLIKPARELDRECYQMKEESPAFFADPRISELIDCYNASISAVSPVFGALAYVARLLFLLKAYLHFHGREHLERAAAELVEARAAA